jgi:hypothetical protein
LKDTPPNSKSDHKNRKIMNWFHGEVINKFSIAD